MNSFVVYDPSGISSWRCLTIAERRRIKPSSSGVSKHDVVPRWHVGPTGLAITRRVSASQSLYISDHVQKMSGSLPFGPQRLARAAEESHVFCCLCDIECLLIHIAQHEDFEGSRRLAPPREADRRQHLERLKSENCIVSECYWLSRRIGIAWCGVRTLLQ